MGAYQLEVSRMTEDQLYKRFVSRCVQLENYPTVRFPASEVRSIGYELRAILGEMRNRGVQMELLR
jgi:hypothetical protein